MVLLVGLKVDFLKGLEFEQMFFMKVVDLVKLNP